MSRYTPYIQVDRKYAADWLKKKGWEPIANPCMPFVPAKWKHPEKGTLSNMDDAVALQMIQERNQ